MSDAPSILVADDNTELREAIVFALRHQGFGVRAARNAYEARKLLLAFPRDLVLTDIRMPGDGMTLLREVRAESPQTPVILMTAYEQPGDRAQALKDGAADFLVKPVGAERLCAAIDDAFARRAGASDASE